MKAQVALCKCDMKAARRNLLMSQYSRTLKGDFNQLHTGREEKYCFKTVWMWHCVGGGNDCTGTKCSASVF